MSAGVGVIGRGGKHQADVLGQLEWVPAFTYPLRLFVEAKFHTPTARKKNRVGIDRVRHAVGIVLDVNQNNYPLRDKGIAIQRHHYAYALFSTSGFSKGAASMALAHQISLIDLSDPSFAALRSVIHRAAADLRDQVISIDENSNSDLDDDIAVEIQDDSDNGDTIASTRNQYVINVRNCLRTALHTIPSEVEVELRDRNTLEPILSPVVSEAIACKELFVGMPNGPFILLLKAADSTAFLKYASVHKRHKVEISWSLREDRGGTWRVYPVADPHAYELTFRLPSELYRLVFRSDSDPGIQARAVKAKYFSSISICRFENGVGEIYRLDYDPVEALSSAATSEVQPWEV
jgi:hypothetical protein